MPVWTTETKDRLSKNLSFNFSVGINYFITRKVGISFDPFFKIDRNYGDFYFSSKVKYYSLGAKVGLTF
ncbi:MAG: hypothetical protein K0S33_730 [Bacteroidetes bacterium]|nr:hypothetical protein [Bacteroidota bacterium]